MKMTFRWFGDGDPVTLDKIRQIPCVTGIVSAVYDVSAGEIWPNKSIARLKKKASESRLEFEVVESVFDWTRSDFKHPLPDGSNSLAYHHETISSIDPVQDNISLPGWDESYSRDALRALLARYSSVTEEKL